MQQEGLGKLKTIIRLIASRTRDLSVCSVAPWPLCYLVPRIIGFDFIVCAHEREVTFNYYTIPPKIIAGRSDWTCAAVAASLVPSSCMELLVVHRVTVPNSLGSSCCCETLEREQYSGLLRFMGLIRFRRIPCNYAGVWFIYRQRVIATLSIFAWAFVVLQNLRLSKTKAIPVTGRGGL
jgi:hypothetical protein